MPPAHMKEGCDPAGQPAGDGAAERGQPEVNTLDSVVLSVTRDPGRQYRNVLPESVELEGTLRTHGQ